MRRCTIARAYPEWWAQRAKPRGKSRAVSLLAARWLSCLYRSSAETVTFRRSQTVLACAVDTQLPATEAIRQLFQNHGELPNWPLLQRGAEHCAASCTPSGRDCPRWPAGVVGRRLALAAELRVGHMAHYHCYLVRSDQSISSRHDIEADNDDDAIAKASLIVASDETPIIEVRDGARLVGRLGDPKESK